MRDKSLAICPLSTIKNMNTGINSGLQSSILRFSARVTTRSSPNNIHANKNSTRVVTTVDNIIVFLTLSCHVT